MILIAVISLGAIGAIGAVFLYAASKKFEVYEDPRIAEVQEALPGANCGGCGYPGCGGFAAACVKADSLEGLLCPVGGAETMGKVASILGMEAASAEPMVAVVGHLLAGRNVAVGGLGQVRGHDRDIVRAVLAVQELAIFEAADFGEGVQSIVRKLRNTLERIK